MTRLARRVALAGFLLLALAAPACGQVAEAHLVASRAVFHDGVSVDSQAQLLHYGRNATAASALPGITVSARHARLLVYDDKGLETIAAGTSVDTTGLARTLQGTPPQVLDLDDVAFLVTGGQADATLNLFAPQASLKVPGTAHGAGLTVLQNPQLMPHGIYEATSSPSWWRGVPVVSGDQADDASFTHATAQTPQVLVASTAGADVGVSGDFVLEVLGLTVSGPARDGPHEVATGTWKSPVHPALEGTSETVHRVFLRIEATDGHLGLEAPIGDLVEWTADEVAAQTASGMDVEDGTGQVRLADGTSLRVPGAFYAVEGAARLQGFPLSDGLQLDVTGLDEHGEPITPASAVARMDPVVALGVTAAIGVLASAISVAWYVSRRFLTRPAITDVERDLEAGRYRRAAAGAKRILRRKPTREDALISRAIALQKSGKSALAVAEVSASLAAREPSDGVLHYVLGVAHQDLGNAAEGERALREAARRTPSLASQVAARLPPEPARADRIVALEGHAYS